MSALPSKLYFRRREVREIFGFSEEAITKLIRGGTLKVSWLPGDKQAYFARQDLVKLLPKDTPAGNPPKGLTTKNAENTKGKTL